MKVDDYFAVEAVKRGLERELNQWRDAARRWKMANVALVDSKESRASLRRDAVNRCVALREAIRALRSGEEVCFQCQ